jgi:hypothetical protein
MGIANACPFGTETYAIVGSIVCVTSFAPPRSTAFVSDACVVASPKEMRESEASSAIGAIPETAASVGSSAARVC